MTPSGRLRRRHLAPLSSGSLHEKPAHPPWRTIRFLIHPKGCIFNRRKRVRIQPALTASAFAVDRRREMGEALRVGDVRSPP